jgi:hypothetical protein
MMISQLIFSFSLVSTSANALPVTSDSYAELEKTAQKEISASARAVLDPAQTESVRQIELQHLLTQLEMQRELERITALVPAVPPDSKVPSTVWKQVALFTAGKLDAVLMQALVARLKHRDPVVEQIGLQKLADELQRPSVAHKSLEAAQTSFLVDDLAKALALIYFRSTSVEPVLMAQLKNTTRNREIAENVTKQLQDVLQESRRDKSKRH